MQARSRYDDRSGRHGATGLIHPDFCFAARGQANSEVNGRSFLNEHRFRPDLQGQLGSRDS